MLSTVTTPGTPYLVTPNQIVVVDISGFGAQNRAIMDITGWIGSVLPDEPVFAPAAGVGSNSFAAADTAASPFDAFASFPPDALGYATTKAPVFKDGAATYADGNAVWARGFGGQRQQDTSGLFAGSTTTGYGGAFGYERVLNSDLKIGALVGASTNKTNLYQNAGSNGIDTVFGGAYGRFTRGSTFLDLAVIGGNLNNSNARTIAGGLALQTATASYGGWFVEPAMTLGQRIEIDQRGFTITPAVKARYVEAHFDGYTETGSTANLTIGGRDFQAWEERAEITFANTGMIGANRITARVTGGLARPAAHDGRRGRHRTSRPERPRRHAGPRQRCRRLRQRRPRLADRPRHAVRGGRSDLHQRRRRRPTPARAACASLGELRRARRVFADLRLTLRDVPKVRQKQTWRIASLGRDAAWLRLLVNTVEDVIALRPCISNWDIH